MDVIIVSQILLELLIKDFFLEKKLFAVLNFLLLPGSFCCLSRFLLDTCLSLFVVDLN